MQASSTDEHYCHIIITIITTIIILLPIPLVILPSAQRSELGSPSSPSLDPTLRHHSHRQLYDWPSQDNDDDGVAVDNNNSYDDIDNDDNYDSDNDDDEW